MTDKPETIFKPGEEYVTRGDDPARVYATDARGDFPIHGAILWDDVWHAAQWMSNGYYGRIERNSFDLIPPKPKPREVWIWDWHKAGLDIRNHSTAGVSAAMYNPATGRAVKFREVLNDD